MKSIKIQISIDVEYESVSDRTPEAITKLIEGSISRNSSRILDVDDLEVRTWNVQAKIFDPNKEKIQTSAFRTTPLADVTAFFSSDGPAIHCSHVHDEEVNGLMQTLSDINAALREAHHKYIGLIRKT